MQFQGGDGFVMRSCRLSSLEGEGHGNWRYCIRSSIAQRRRVSSATHHLVLLSGFLLSKQCHFGPVSSSHLSTQSPPAWCGNMVAVEALVFPAPLMRMGKYIAAAALCDTFTPAPHNHNHQAENIVVLQENDDDEHGVATSTAGRGEQRYTNENKQQKAPRSRLNLHIAETGETSPSLPAGAPIVSKWKELAATTRYKTIESPAREASMFRDGDNGDDDDEEESSQEAPEEAVAEEAVAAVAAQRLPGSRFLRLVMSNPKVELKDGLLVVLSSFLVGIGTIKSLPRAAVFPLALAENAIAGVFLSEFLLRWYCFGRMRLGFLLRPMAVVDFLSFLPLGFEVVPRLKALLPVGAHVLSDNLLINLRLLRLLRLQRFLLNYDTFKRLQLACGVKEKKVKRYQLQLARVLLSLFTLLSVSTGLIYAAEHAVNPAMPDYFTAMYFGVTTITTVGFGDIAPVTPYGRLIVCGTILAGISIFPPQVSSFVEALLGYKREMDAEGGKKAGMARNSLDKYHVQEERNAAEMLDFYDKYKLDSCGCAPRSEVATACPACGAKPHREDAEFCWGCGASLPTNEREAAVTLSD